MHNIAIVGATGLVGSTLLNLLSQKNFPYNKLFLLASSQSAGKEIIYQDNKFKIHDLATFDFSQTTIAFFCVGNELSSQYVPIATKAGNVVIDKSNFYRNHSDVPLIVPEVNCDYLAGFKKMNIIANPNCSTIPLAVALKPIYDAVGILRVNVTTFQSVSGTGKDAVAELTKQTSQLLANEDISPHIYPQQIAFNVLPHIDDFQENGYTREEMKIVLETKKIFSDDAIAINPTAVRVPVYCGHAAAVHIETNSKITAREALSLLSNSPSVKVISGEYPYPTPVKDAAGSDHVYVGRIREDISHDNGLNLWVVADNLRKGAALNALQIADYLIKDYLPS